MPPRSRWNFWVDVNLATASGDGHQIGLYVQADKGGKNLLENNSIDIVYNIITMRKSHHSKCTYSMHSDKKEEIIEHVKSRSIYKSKSLVKLQVVMDI